ncbi:MAG: ABC transporter substrate-binding protein [Candidatus Bathyarchaeota archaeon]|nr:ABC transporter substrate-binding protein [Candidatus Bathyarchaeota archaeon]
MQRKLIVILGLIAIIIVVVAAFAFTGQLNPAPSAEARPIKIGLVACSQRAEGDDMNRAAQLAVKEINDAGGVYVKEWNTKVPIELVTADTLDDSVANAVEPVKQAVLNEKVDMLIGGYASAGTLANEVVAMDNRVPYIVTGASSTLITRRGPQGNYAGLAADSPQRTEDAEGMSYIFHYCVTTYEYSKTVLNFLNSTMKPTLDATYGFDESRPLRLAIIYRNDPFGQGVVADSKAIIESENLPITIVAERPYTATAVSFQTDLGVVQAKKPDAVYVVDFIKNTAEIYTEAQRDVKLNTALIAVECCDDPAFYKLIGSYGDGMLIESQFGPYTDPLYLASIQKYYDDFKAMHSKAPGFMGASTYDAFYIAKDAIERAGTVDKAAVREAIEGCSMNQLLMMTQTGKIEFSTGTNYHEVQITTFMEQMTYKADLSECRNKIVYPESASAGTLQQAEFKLPAGYQPGSP